MKLKRLLAFILSALTLVFILASCDGNGGNTAETTTAAPEVTVTVSIVVKDIEDKVVYEVPEYTYKGTSPTPMTLLDFCMFVELEKEVVKDEYDEIISIGDVTKSDIMGTDASGAEVVLKNTYWWYTVNGKRSDKGMDEYVVKSGDKIVFYLEKTNPS